MANFAKSKFHFETKWIYTYLLCLISAFTMLPLTLGLPAKTGASSRALDSGSEVDFVQSNALSNPPDSISPPTSSPHKITVYPWNNHLGTINTLYYF